MCKLDMNKQYGRAIIRFYISYNYCDENDLCFTSVHTFIFGLMFVVDIVLLDMTDLKLDLNWLFSIINVNVFVYDTSNRRIKSTSIWCWV